MEALDARSLVITCHAIGFVRTIFALLGARRQCRSNILIELSLGTVINTSGSVINSASIGIILGSPNVASGTFTTIRIQ